MTRHFRRGAVRSPSVRGVTIETVTPSAMMPMEELDGDALLIRVMQVGKRCVINLAEDSRYLSNFCEKLERNDAWKKVAPTWDEFCQKAFGHPSAYVDMLRAGVVVLDGLKNETEKMETAKIEALISTLQGIVKERG